MTGEAFCRASPAGCGDFFPSGSGDCLPWALMGGCDACAAPALACKVLIVGELRGLLSRESQCHRQTRTACSFNTACSPHLAP